jgi:hypothetical protein
MALGRLGELEKDLGIMVGMIDEMGGDPNLKAGLQQDIKAVRELFWTLKRRKV